MVAKTNRVIQENNISIDHLEGLFKQHLTGLCNEVSAALDAHKLEGVVIDSGYPLVKTYDDQYHNHNPNFYFSYFCPDRNPFHFLVIRKNKKPELYYYITDDFWHEVKKAPSDFWVKEFELKTFSDLNVRLDVIGKLKLPIITPNTEDFKSQKVFTEKDLFLHELNWLRSKKSDYEKACVRLANQIASYGHIKSKKSFFEGRSEHEVYLDFLSATGTIESQLPYGAIVAFNDKSATLHYEVKRTDKLNNQTFLIDAGVQFNGYASDITRTYYQKNVMPEFATIVDECHSLNKKMCDLVKSGVDYKSLHYQYQLGVGEILINQKVLSGDPELLIDKGVLFYFSPHGLGHPLGLQVHDVTGKVTDSKGSAAAKDERFPYLRTLRVLHERDIVTIEPGIYFISALLSQLKNSQDSKLVNWPLVEKLIPLGGVRVEDNVFVTSQGHENLTRPFLNF